MQHQRRSPTLCNVGYLICCCLKLIVYKTLKLRYTHIVQCGCTCLLLYKTLKLRYTHIVMSLSYRELLALNEQQLEKMGVTKVTFFL